MRDSKREEVERVLRAASLRGDADAWRVLHADHDAFLRAHLRRRIQEADRLDDLAQETWITAVKRIRDFDPARASFAAWLRGIAENQVRNAFRSRRRDRHVESEANDTVACDPGLAERLGLREGLELALATLDERSRVLLRARYVEQCSLEEIAVRLRTTRKAVESALARVRDSMRSKLERWGVEP